mgnify:CR=1 FL=1
MNSIEFIQQTLPLLTSHVIDRADKECTDSTVKIYWAGTIIRIDIKPK